MLIAIDVMLKRTGLLASKRAQRKYAPMIKSSLQWLLLWWHEKYLQKHFGPAAAVNARYPGVYAERTREYQRRKRRAKGHTRMLEWSGELRQSVTQQKRTGGSTKRAWIRMRYPSRVSQSSRGKWSSQRYNNIERELTAIAGVEEKAMARAFEKHLVAEIKKIKDPEVVRVRAG